MGGAPDACSADMVSLDTVSCFAGRLRNRIQEVAFGRRCRVSQWSFVTEKGRGGGMNVAGLEASGTHIFETIWMFIDLKTNMDLGLHCGHCVSSDRATPVPK